MSCHICGRKKSFAHSQIWDGSDFIRLGKQKLSALKTYELECMRFSLSCKDCWEKSDFEGAKLIEGIIWDKEDKKPK